MGPKPHAIRYQLREANFAICYLQLLTANFNGFVVNLNIVSAFPSKFVTINYLVVKERSISYRLLPKGCLVEVENR